MNSINNIHPVTMFYGASPLIMKRARLLRAVMTKPEKIVWELLKDNSILGLKFRRQHPLNNYIADFYCHKIKLVVEIDGLTHRNDCAREYDERRTNVMNSFNIEVIRFDNETIFRNLPFVKNAIALKCSELLQGLNTKPTA